MKFETYRDNNGQWRWKLISDNNRIVANSGEGYHNKADMLAAIELVRNSTGENVTVEHQESE